MSLEIYICLVMLAFVVTATWTNISGNIELKRRVKELEEQKEWFVQRSEKHRECIEFLDEWKDEFKKELIQRRREIDWLKAQVAKLQAEKKETPEEKEADNGRTNQS